MGAQGNHDILEFLRVNNKRASEVDQQTTILCLLVELFGFDF